MRLKRTAAAILAFIMIFTLGGCGTSFLEALGNALNDRIKDPDGAHDRWDRDEEQGDEEENPSTPADGDYFTGNPWRGDADYSEMEYSTYDIEDFTALTEPIYEMAENGGTEDEFAEADFLVYDELMYIYTLYTLISIESYKDASDQAAAEETVRALETYYKAYDEYMLAMRALAESDHAELMEASYGDTAISYFLFYEPSTDEDMELVNRESRLVQEYYTLMNEDEPDLDAVGKLYVELVELRKTIAEMAGYSSYADYAYEVSFSKDYSPEDAETVWRGAKEYFVPLLARYGADVFGRSEELYYSDDLDCSPERVLDALGKGAEIISPELREAYDYMTEHGLCDISQDPQKADLGFTTVLYYYNEPFIFNSATGTYADYSDLFHEFGHFTNYYYIQSDLIFGMPDNDLSELQSQGLEVLFTFIYDELFEEEVADIMRDDLLLEMAMSVVEGALYDEFQQRVFAEEELTPERVNEIYAELYREYGYVPYEGYEYEWTRVIHNFEAPFYYISYAVSALAALEINDLCLESWERGVDKYLTVASMDTEAYYYSEALEEAGLSDTFDVSSYSEIAEGLMAAIEK